MIKSGRAINKILDSPNMERVFTLLQLRGSIPIFWTQQPSLKYCPDCVIGQNDSQTYKAFKTHIKGLLNKHEKMSMINLVDKKGFQFRIGQKFEEMFELFRKNFKHPRSINLSWFDYHHECKGMKVENCAKLMDDLKSSLQDYGWLEFEIYKDQKPLKVMSYQKGVVRTNCVDCLDRTNVLQSIVGRYYLLTILYSNDIIKMPTDPYFGHLPGDLETAFRETWVINGNRMSMLYAGTPALKTDFTRLGKRTIKGMIDDGVNSVTRYFIIFISLRFWVSLIKEKDI